MMCGAPASGKSSWATKFIFSNQEDIRYISRDDIRFSLLKDGEDYFSHEKEVFKKFAGAIAQTLIDGFDVIADATHLNWKSRQKLWRALHTIGVDFHTICVCMDTPLEVCLERNQSRAGRARVPNYEIENMYDCLSWPTINEDKSIREIWRIREDE